MISLLKNQVVQTLVLAAIGITAIALCRQPTQFGMSEANFWSEKSSWHQEASMVIGGDSRVYRGVSPTVMAKTLKTHQIKNFGFAGLGYSPEYLTRLSNVLDPDADEKIIVLGISPNSLTPKAAETNGFVRIEEISEEHPLAFISSNEKLSPMKLGSLARLVLGRKQPTFTREEFFATGYMAVQQRPRDLSGLNRYKKIFENNQVADTIQTDIIRFIQQQTEQGVQVFVTRPPVADEMLALENEKSGFDELTFYSAVESVGGEIIRVKSKFETYDGHHLDRDSSEAYSEFLATAINDFAKHKRTESAN
ncbi:MAG: hypothetical protein AB8B55_20800 [Mariniblastus sp.]